MGHIYKSTFACVQATSIFTDTLRHLRYGVRRIIHQGGQYSGKTVNILGALATLCSEESEGVTTVTGMSFPHLKGGALRDFEMYVYPSFKNQIKQYHKTDHVFTFKSGSMLEFKVFENEMAARGQKRKRLFINEANKFDYLVFFQLDSRSDQTILDYNPTIRFWVHDKLIDEPGNQLLISDHRHNPFLTKEKHEEIEKICQWGPDGKIIKGDYELWKVYARGVTGNVTGLIFPNWQMIDDDKFPKGDDYDWVYSIDFGFTNDPTAIIKQCKIGDSLYVKELSYETGLSVYEIKNILEANGYNDDYHALYCDHVPEMIWELRNKVGITSATPARKGQGSINAGIELLKQYNVFYPASSRNLHRERSMYIWETNELGDSTNKPVDNNNHCFDAIRYGAYTRYLKVA